ncbi:hypothetical protein G6F22_012309 [Rhizopus arrhizus]|nr:hypothetical protein G6F22_012309 [Rhizopus arrhizus]
MGMRQVVYGGQQRAGERLTVGRDAADRDAAETHAVIAAFAADQAGALAFAAGPVVSQGNFQGRIDGLGAGVREEDAVQALGHEAGDSRGGFEGQRVAQLEAGRGIHDAGLAGNRVDDFLAAVAGVDAPQAGGAVEDRAAIDIFVVHALGAYQYTRRRLVLAIGGEWHPVRVQGLGALGGQVVQVAFGTLHASSIGCDATNVAQLRHGEVAAAPV